MHHVDDLLDLVSAIRKLTKATSLEEIYPLASRTAENLLGADASSFAIPSDGNTCMYVEASDESLVAAPMFQVQDSAAGRCIIGQKMLILTQSDSWKDVPAIYADGLLVPVAKDPAVAAIGVYWSAPYAPSENEIKLVQILADSAAQAIEGVNATTELESRIAERTLSLQAVNEELQTFAYTVSHDLKTPISVVKTGVWTLRQLSGDQADERIEKCLSRLDSAADRMRSQIDGMLAMYRLTRDEINPVEIDLSSMATEILTDLIETNPNRSVTIDISPDLSTVGDPSMLRVALENLIGNAWKYSSKEEHSIIAFGVEEIGMQGGNAFFVRDNGVGFDMARATKLFGVFQRLHTDQEFSGSGVGLASAQRILHKHGGLVWAESEPGKGATFYFTLPVQTILNDLPVDAPTAE